MDKVNQSCIDKRFTLDRQIQDLIGSAFEDYGLDGIRYAAKEISRITASVEKENETGSLTA